VIDFCPAETPLQVPVLTSFQLRDQVYVVDVEGLLLNIQTGPERVSGAHGSFDGADEGNDAE